MFLESSSNKFNPVIHNRHSIRLKAYDYALAGKYFITLCCQDNTCFFGSIEDGVLLLNDAGRMIDRWFLKLPKKFPDLSCGEYIIMPNHFHAIIINQGPVGADPCVCPGTDQFAVSPVGAHPCVCPKKEGEHMGSPLPTVVRWFKTMTTNEYIRGVKEFDWLPFRRRLWQRNYFEHIIRSQPSYERIKKYILQNPAKWESDKYHI